MRPVALRSVIALAIVGLVAASSAFAVTLVRMNLADMCDDAGRIFSGTVVEANSGKIQAGGGELPVMTYKVVVDDALKGEFIEIKGQRIGGINGQKQNEGKVKRVAEFTMLGKFVPPGVEGMARFDPLPGLPVLEVGSKYLIFQTTPGSAGLSTTIGLGQGWFRIGGKDDKAFVVNGFDNTGLFTGMEVTGAPARGPISYSFMVEQIRAQLGAE